MIKEIKYKGFTATPSDYECPDGDLDAAINLVPENYGELKVLGQPKEIDELSEGEELLLVHVVNSNARKNLIIKKTEEVTENNETTTTYTLCYRELGSTEEPTVIKTYDDDFKCSATGNVLCVYGMGEMEHFLYLYGSYQNITPDMYACTILFGIDASTQSEAETIHGILKDAQGEPIYRYDNIYTGQLERRGTSGISVTISLSTGKEYRFCLTPNNGATVYVRATFYKSNGEWFTMGLGLAGEYRTVSLMDDAVRVHFAFYTRSDYTGISSSTYWVTITIDEAIEIIQPGQTQYSYNPDESVNTALLGVVNKLLAKITNANKFALPFFVRYGFRLITGDIVTVSPPILIEPNTGVTPIITLSNITHNQGALYSRADATATMYECVLKYKVRDISKIQDIKDDEIIDSLVIAVSDPIYMYKQGATQQECAEEIYVSDVITDSKCYAIDGINTIQIQSDYYLTLPSYNDYAAKLENVSAFKIVAEIPKEEIDVSNEFTEVQIPSYSLSGLAGNVTLLEDNVEQLNSYDSKYVMTYNQREHWIGVTEKIFGGFDLDAMCGYVKDTPASSRSTNYKIGYKQEDSPELQYMIRGEKTESSINRRWFYYPSTKAANATIYENSKAYDIKLIKHQYLNGAFYFGEYGEGVADAGDGVSQEPFRLSENKPNMLYVSVQANSIVIDQRIRIGDGVLLAGATNTRPISSGQYGQAPLYALSTDGVWAIEVNEEGKYSARQAATRDVLLNKEGSFNTKSITLIDNAVLFVTDRGIMLLSGNNSICISDDINGTTPVNLENYTGLNTLLSTYEMPTVNDCIPFLEFLEGSNMLYDYINQHIVVYNPTKGYAYVYSLKSKKWGMMTSNLLYDVDCYPNAWAVVPGENNKTKIVNLSKQDGIHWTAEEIAAAQEGDPAYGKTTDDWKVAPDDTITNALLITRPLKLDYPNDLKTIDTVIQRGKFSIDRHNPHIKSILYGSRDLYNWFPVWSSVDHIMRGFRGTPYKYFRIVLLCNLQKDESIFGCTVQFTPRLLDQPR